MESLGKRSIRVLLTAELLFKSKMAFALWVQPFAHSIAPSDALNGSPEGIGAASTLLWSVRGLAVVAATVLLTLCARQLHREDYYAALITFIGALIAGASPYLSTALFLG